MKCWGLNYADGSRTAGLKAFLDGPLGLSLGVCVCVYLLFLPLSGRCSSPPASYLRPEGDGSMTVPQSNHIHNHSKRKKRQTSKERLGHQRLVEACWLLGTSALGDWMIGPYLKVRAFFHPLLGGGLRVQTSTFTKTNFQMDLDKKLQSYQDRDIVVIIPWFSLPSHHLSPPTGTSRENAGQPSPPTPPALAVVSKDARAATSLAFASNQSENRCFHQR